MKREICYNLTGIIIAGLFLFCGVCVYYIYIYNKVKQIVEMPEKTNKITIQILASGFTVTYFAMMLPVFKETLDFDVYNVQIRLFYVVRLILFFGMIIFGLVTGGTFLANFIKGKQ